jgi:hypothetical protein
MQNRRNFMAATAAFGAVTMAGPALAGQSRKGTFKGRSDHVTSGGVTFTKEGGKTYVVLQSDFAFDGAPDPKVALGRNGYDKSTVLGALRSNSGEQRYEIPASMSVEGVNEVWIWCEQFNVPLGVATLH